MGCYRAPSSTSSIDSDAPIPETPQEGPAKPQIPGRLSKAFSRGEQPPPAVGRDETGVWTIYVGNLHPKVEAAELYHLLNGGDHIRNIVIRTSRGCCASSIPEESIGPNDRNYATVLVIGWNRVAEIMGNCDPKNPPMLRGLPIEFKLSAMDMPEVTEILESVGLVPKNETKRTKKRIPNKRIVRQETEKDIEDQPRPLAGPSRSAQSKSRHNPLRRTDRAY